jgi:hypothetical protein
MYIGKEKYGNSTLPIMRLFLLEKVSRYKARIIKRFIDSSDPKNEFGDMRDVYLGATYTFDEWTQSKMKEAIIGIFNANWLQ